VKRYAFCERMGSRRRRHFSSFGSFGETMIDSTERSGLEASLHTVAGLRRIHTGLQLSSSCLVTRSGLAGLEKIVNARKTSPSSCDEIRDKIRP
jgi:hypothetical protein